MGEDVSEMTVWIWRLEEVEGKAGKKSEVKTVRRDWFAFIRRGVLQARWKEVKESMTA